MSESEGMIQFLQGVQWTEPWLCCLYVYYSINLLIIYLLRHYVAAQAVHFLFLLVQLVFAEQINEFAATNWSSYANDQYFDSEGYFIAIIFVLPIMFLCVCILGSWFYTLLNLMAFVKGRKLKAEAALKRKEAAKAKAAENASEGATQAESSDVLQSKEKAE